MAVDDSTHCSRLLFTSTDATGVPGREMIKTGRDIAAKSARLNKHAGLCGLLMAIEGQYFQVIEGPSAKLEQTFERICTDFRHRDVKLIDLVSADTLMFRGFDMAFLSLEQQSDLIVREAMCEIRFLIGANASEAVRHMRALLDLSCIRQDCAA